jgi:hypothetical protein
MTMPILVRRGAMENNVWRPMHLKPKQMEERLLVAARLLHRRGFPRSTLPGSSG